MPKIRCYQNFLYLKGFIILNYFVSLTKNCQNQSQNTIFLTVELSRNRDRTDMVLLPADFESTASTNSAMRPILRRILKKRIQQVKTQNIRLTYLRKPDVWSLSNKQFFCLILLQPQNLQDLHRRQDIRNLREDCLLHIHIRIIHICTSYFCSLLRIVTDNLS